MLDIFLKPRAREDLSEIYEYTYLEWGRKQAEHYQDDLYVGMRVISEYPESGQPYPYHDKDYRKLHVNRHLIFYRVEEKQLIIIRILHEKVDIQGHLGRK